MPNVYSLKNNRLCSKRERTKNKILGNLTHLEVICIRSNRGNSLVVQWLGLCTFTAEGPGSFPGQGTKKIPQATQPGQKQQQKYFEVLGVRNTIQSIVKGHYLKNKKQQIERRLILVLWRSRFPNIPPPETAKMLQKCLNAPFKHFADLASR